MSETYTRIYSFDIDSWFIYILYWYLHVTVPTNQFCIIGEFEMGVLV